MHAFGQCPLPATSSKPLLQQRTGSPAESSPQPSYLLRLILACCTARHWQLRVPGAVGSTRPSRSHQPPALSPHIPPHAVHSGMPLQLKMLDAVMSKINGKFGTNTVMKLGAQTQFQM